MCHSLRKQETTVQCVTGGDVPSVTTAAAATDIRKGEAVASYAAVAIRAFPRARRVLLPNYPSVCVF